MSSRVYIGRLPDDCRERDIEKFFKGYGRIRDILIKNGFGFVEFNDHRDADDAVYELNGKEMLGERVILELARGPARRGSSSRFGGGGGGGGGGRRRGSWLDKYGPPTRTEYRVVVENLSSRVSWQDLKDFMRTAGDVTYADAHKQRKNEGVVEFSSYSDMKNAISKLDDTELSGRRIRIVEDRPSRGSRRSRSRSSSRSRSRSRSRSPRHSRSRSRSPRHSKSRSRSRSPKRAPLSRSRSRSRSPPPKRSGSRSRSRSPPPKGSGSRSRSRSPPPKRSGSGSRSRSPPPKMSGSRSRSRSPPPKMSGSRSHSRSPPRVERNPSRSRSPSPA